MPNAQPVQHDIEQPVAGRCLTATPICVEFELSASDPLRSNLRFSGRRRLQSPAAAPVATGSRAPSTTSASVPTSYEFLPTRAGSVLLVSTSRSCFKSKRISRCCGGCKSDRSFRGSCCSISTRKGKGSRVCTGSARRGRGGCRHSARAG